MFKRIYFKVAASAAIALVILGTGPLTVQAAPLTYTTDTTISLTSPAVNFTIKSGSVADSLTVNAGNVVLSLSSSTGGSFTLT